MKKRILTMLLAVLLCAGLLPLGSAAADLKFVDVSPEAWYYNDVKTAVDSGLVNGKSETTYCPDDNLTYAEAVKLAACMHQKYTTGVVSLVNGDPWYMSYVDYAKMNAIISKNYDWNSKATRAGYMAIFAHALPDTALTAANSVTDGSIPDVPMSHPQAAEIYKLYRAGILQGSADTYKGAWTEHLSKPDDSIKRSEVAAILTRMMFVDKRISFSLGAEAPKTDALKITKQPASYALKKTDETVSFTVEISGGKAPYTYKWVIEKETGSSPTSGTSEKKTSTFNVPFGKDSFAYSKYVRVYVEVTDSDGTKVTSEKAEVTPFVEGLKITKQPADYQMKSASDTAAAFTVEISGGKAPYTYEWIEELDGVPAWYSDISSSELKNTFAVKDAVLLLSQAKTVKLFCQVTDADGKKVTSEKAELKGYVEGLKITKDLEAVTLKEGEKSATFSITVSGGKAPYEYRWRLESDGGGSDDVYTSSEKTCVYNTGDITTELYYFGLDLDVICFVTDSAGQQVTSKRVSISPYVQTTDPLKIIKQPKDASASEGSIVSFDITVTGGKAPYTYDWQMTHTSPAYSDYNEWGSFNSSLNGKSTLSFETDWYSFADEYQIYRCVVTDQNGNKAVSNTFTIYRNTGTGGLTITKQPSDHWMNSSMEEVTFTITVDGGMSPYTFDWYWGRPGAYSKFDSVFTNMDSATGKEVFSDYDFEALQATEIDIYCVVTDDWGATVTSKICHIYQY